MRVFCTLFDSNYVSRGLSMYESLARHCPDFVLYIFAFDERALVLLRRLALPNVVVVSLAEFEDPELLRVKPGRSHAEYCWTCASSTVLWVLNKHCPAACTYIDADTYFYTSPDPLLQELGAASVSITEHRFTPSYDISATAGIYNVQFMTFRNDERGLRIARWWRNACIESCEFNEAEGKCYDQKYLDDWTSRFDGVHVMKHLGCGVAPWNVQQYEFRALPDGVWGTERVSRHTFPLIFYHFHGLKLSTSGRVTLSGGRYEISSAAAELIYRPYLAHLQAIGRRLTKMGERFDPHGLVGDAEPTLLERLERFTGRFRGIGARASQDDNVNVPRFLTEVLRGIREKGAATS